MMKFEVLTIFPEALESPLSVGLLGKAQASGIIDIDVHDLRKWTDDPNRKVDDEPFGGGAGMVMTPGPIVVAVEHLRKDDSQVLVLAASGSRFDQSRAKQIALRPHVILVCGRYEGIDARVGEILGAEEISIGDFVLTGGEVAALAVIEATARLLPGFMGNEQSKETDSFSQGLLEYPQYTRPARFRDMPVPEVLLSGDHAKIAKWRREQSLRRTFEIRPDLLSEVDLTDEEKASVDSWWKETTN